MFSKTSCVTCGDSVTDPVCRNCYIKQTRVLLNDLEVNTRISNFIFDKIKDRFPIENTSYTRCILCRKENVTLCRYCFSILLIKILRELNFTEDLIENFEYDPVYGEISSEDYSENLLGNSLEDESILDFEMEMK